jgi:hypothetical protein
MSQASFIAPSARSRRIFCSASGMAGGRVRITRRSRRGTSAKRRAARVAGALIWLTACISSSASRKVNMRSG